MKVSIITVCYNAADTIAGTIRSVRDQDFPNIEHLIIDGASTDATADIVANHAWPSLKWFSEPDGGLYDAMNKGVTVASGDVIGFLNADDFFATDTAISSIVDALQDGDADFCYGNLAIVKRDNTNAVTRFYDARGFRKWHIHIGDIPPHPTVYARVGPLREWGEFNTRFRIAADFDLISRALFHYNAKSAFIPKTLVIQRDGGVSTNGLASTVTINREIVSSLSQNHIFSLPFLPWFRYFYKVLQFVRRPRDLGAVETKGGAGVGTI